MLTFSLGAGLAGLQRRAPRPDHVDRALHGPAVRRARLHHRRGRRCDERHRRRARFAACSCRSCKTPVGFLFGAFLGLVALLLAALLIIRLMPDGISATCSAGTTSARGWPDRCACLATARQDPRMSADRPWFWLGFAWLWSDFLSTIRRSSASSMPRNIAFYLLNIPMALGLCLLWGYCGVLSFGQVAYFGIAGYLYGIIAGNLIGNPWGAAHRLARRARRLRAGRWRSSATSSSTPACRRGSPRS